MGEENFNKVDNVVNGDGAAGTGPDDAEGQALNAAPSDDDGQLEGGKGATGEPQDGEGEGFAIPPDEEEAWAYLEKKGMGVAGLVKSYGEAEKKISEMGAELSMLRQMVARMGTQTPAAQTYSPSAQVAKPDPLLDPAEIARLVSEEGPEGVAKAMMALRQSLDREATEKARRSNEFNAIRPQAEAWAQQQIRDSRGELPQEAKTHADQIMKENALVNMVVRGITADNYDSYGVEGMREIYSAAYELVHDAALGRAAREHVQKEKIEAIRKTKEGFYKKVAAGGRPAGASPKPTKMPAQSNGPFDLLERAARAKI